MADLIVTGGGTGGHLYPALAVADAVKALRPDARVLFVGTPDRLEARVVPAWGYPFAAIPARGLSRRPLAAAAAALLLGLAVARALALLARERPRAVLGSGGYVSAPVLLAARLLRIPTFLQEQNVVPGKVNRLLARFAEGVAVAFPESVPYFPAGKALVLGNPVRQAAFALAPAAAKAALGYGPDARLLLVTGGSQGAARINAAVSGFLPRFLTETDWHLLHVTGPGKDAAAREAAGALAADPRYRVLPYMDDMPCAIAASDLVVSRAGATTIAELTATGKPMLLVPYPHAGAHQEANARAVADAGGAIVEADQALTPERLGAVLLPLIRDRGRLQSMASASRGVGKPEAATAIAERLLAKLGPIR